MDVIGTILPRIPLFRHCLEEELRQLRAIGKMAEVKKGHQFDLKKVNSLNVVVNGIFEIESAGNTDVVYLAPGSFFGAIPFTENRQAGRIRAVVDSTILMFAAEDMFRFLLMSYRCLRGYLKIIGRMGFDVSDVGKEYFGGMTRIITSYSSLPGAGKSLLASLMGAALKGAGKTIVLDMSYAGSSVFNFFERKITAPLSHRAEDGPSFEEIIRGRIERVDDGLDIVNVAFGSKVKVNPDILSPLLFMLSKEYRYIVIDCGDDDPGLRDRVIGLSDRVFTLVKNRKDIRSLHEVFDGSAREGQRVYYVLNEFHAGDVRDFPGGLTLPKFDAPSAGEYERIRRIAGGDDLSPLVSLVTKKNRALVLETGLLNALYYGGLFGAMQDAGVTCDLLYASSYAYIVAALSLLSGSGAEFRKHLDHFFSEDRMSRLLDITFPTDHVFKNDGVVKLAGEICGSARIESFRGLPVAMLGQGGTSGRRLCSTGYLRDMVAASFCLYPVFEEVPILEGRYNAGYPGFSVRAEDLLRIDVDETVCVSVRNAMKPTYRDGKLMSFFTRYLDFIGDQETDNAASDLADERIVIEVSEKDVRPGKILDYSREISDKLVKKLSLKS
jgi:hypothetical protein